jgi:hypothetical protein
MQHPPLSLLPPVLPPAEQQLALMHMKLLSELIENVSTILTGGLQDLLRTHEELAATLATVQELSGSPAVETVRKAQAVIRDLLTVVEETLREGNKQIQERDPTKTLH